MRYIKTALLTFVLLAGVAAGTAVAGKYPYRYTYYDAEGEVVGVRSGTCSGSYFSWGITTDLYTFEYLSCEP